MLRRDTCGTPGRREVADGHELDGGGLRRRGGCERAQGDDDDAADHGADNAPPWSGVRTIIRGVGSSRFLFEQLVRRELRQKYQGSVLGLAWYLINPLVLMAAYWFLFGVVLKVFEVPDYPLFLLCGLVVWIFFSQALTAASTSLLDQGALIRKARFPREAIPASVVAVQLVTFLALLVLVAVVCVVLRGTLDVALLVLPVVLAALAAFALGLGAGRRRAARLLPRRRADPRRRAAALVLPLADLLQRRAHHAGRRSSGSRWSG